MYYVLLSLSEDRKHVCGVTFGSAHKCTVRLKSVMKTRRKGEFFQIVQVFDRNPEREPVVILTA